MTIEILQKDGALIGIAGGIFVLSLICLGIYSIVKTKKAQKQRAGRKSLYGAIDYTSLVHISGLSIPAGTFCTGYICSDKYLFEQDEDIMELPFMMIRDVSLNTEVEAKSDFKRKSLKSILLNRMRKREYIIFTYIQGKTAKKIKLDCTGNPKAEEFVRACEPSKKFVQAKQKKDKLN